jgi:fructose-1,6-bisphosphatase I
VFLDPLDGSSNIDVNINVGTIFSIYHKNSNLLQPGCKQVAAGYVIYGSSVMFVYSCGHGVNGFTLDPSIGAFLLSHPQIKIPQKGSIYSINEGNYLLWEKSTKKYIDYLKQIDKETSRPYKARYVGSMVADIHRTLLKGGIFLYPADKKNPEGKLRLMFEINPLSFIAQQAGGASYSGEITPLDIKPKSLSQKVPVAIGSLQDVQFYYNFVK